MMSKLQEKRLALKSEHPAFQNMKFRQFLFYFCGSFCSWIRIRIQSTKINEGGADPDPKHRFIIQHASVALLRDKHDASNAAYITFILIGRL
jgi:hypothetical protein